MNKIRSRDRRETLADISLSDEVWKPVKGTTKYWVSNKGRFCKKYLTYFEAVEGSKTELGYILVSIRENNKPKTALLHRLVAEAFFGETTPDKPFVNHKNFNTSDNSVENLEWCSPKENSNHFLDAKGAATYGKRVWTSKLNCYSALTVLTISKIWSQRKIAEHYGVSQAAIQAITSRRAWSDRSITLELIKEENYE